MLRDARVRGLGAVCITYCVGGLKVVNSTAEAFAEKSPVVVISGAPVVDHTGRCVGVLSTTDFVEWAGRGGGTQQGRGDASVGACEWEIITTNAPPEEQVRDWMTPDPVTAPPTASLNELARSMVDAHVHRVIVAEEDGRPIGIVSSTDILAAVAYADKR